MTHSSIPQDTTAEELPRARFELREESEGRPLARFALGMLIANALLLVKDLLFGKAPAAETARGAEVEPRARIADDVLDVGDGDGGRGADAGASAAFRLPEPEDTLQPITYGVGLAAATDAVRHGVPVARIAFHGGSALPPVRAASNDNEPSQPLQLATRSPGGGGDGGGDGGDELPAALPRNPYRPRDDEEDDEENEGPNRAPVVAGGVTLGDVLIAQTIVIGSIDLLRLASDPDGDMLMVRNLAVSSGTLTAAEGARWIFTPSSDASGEVVFSYDISDGQFGVAQTAVMHVVAAGETATAAGDIAPAPAGSSAVGDSARTAGIEARPLPTPDAAAGEVGTTIIGSDANDVIVGTAGNDVIRGGAGDDVIDAGGGDDAVFAEAGDDTIVATVGDGDDVIDGGDGSDTLDMSATDADAVIDLAQGTAQSADSGNDTIARVENVVTGAGADTITGSDDANMIATGSGDDTVAAAGNNDVIDAGSGNDTVDAGSGDDTIVATVGDGDDVIDGGDGCDTLDMSATDADAVIDLAQGTAQSADSGNDTIARVENVVTGAGADTITGSADANMIATGGGDDVIDAGSGNDTVDAGSDDDTIVATVGDGDDVIDGGDGCDTLDMSAIAADAVIDLAHGTAQSADGGNDSIVGIENAVGGSGDDTLIADDQVNELFGGAGDDVFVFTSSLAAGRGDGARDRIMDFDVGDRIDIDEISREFADRFEDALADEGIRRFVLLRDGEAFSEPGQIRIQYQQLDDGRSLTIIEGNVDGDTDTEFEIELAGHHDLDSDRFYHRYDCD